MKNLLEGQLTKIGIAISIAWAYSGVLLVAKHNGSNLDLNEWGDFLAGMAGPLALLWLVLGYFQQRKELTQNTEALDNQRVEMERATEQQEFLVQSSRSLERITSSEISAHLLPVVRFDLLDSDGVVLSPGIHRGEVKLRPIVEIKNFGSKPARDVSISVYFQPLIVEVRNQRHGPMPERTLIASSTIGVFPPNHTDVPALPIGENTQELIQRPKGAPDNPDYAVWIKIEYRDLYDYRTGITKTERFLFKGGVTVVFEPPVNGKAGNYASGTWNVSESITSERWPNNSELRNYIH